MNVVIELLTAAASGGVAGCLAARIQLPRRQAYRHQHAWGQWEDCQLSNTWGPVDNRRTELHPGQKRECFGCGEREVRDIKAKTA